MILHPQTWTVPKDAKFPCLGKQLDRGKLFLTNLWRHISVTTSARSFPSFLGNLPANIGNSAWSCGHLGLCQEANISALLAKFAAVSAFRLGRNYRIFPSVFSWIRRSHFCFVPIVPSRNCPFYSGASPQASTGRRRRHPVCRAAAPPPLPLFRPNLR